MSVDHTTNGPDVTIPFIPPWRPLPPPCSSSAPILLSRFCLGIALVEAWLSPEEIFVTRQLATPSPTTNFLCAPFPSARPDRPFKRRIRGFGRQKTDIDARHDCPSIFLMFHFCWDFCTHHDRARLMQVSQRLTSYAQLRRTAFRRRWDVKALQQPRPMPAPTPVICRERSWLLGAALLSFDFIHGDVIRWLGGEYTHAHRDWDEFDRTVDLARQHQPLPGQPKVDFDRASLALKEGAPLAGDFECRWTDVMARAAYNNHPPLQDALEDVRKKFALEEAYSYHILYPRFVAHFIYGLFLVPVSWVVQKGKGRIIHDASAKLFTGDTGAPNDYIPKAGSNENESPAVYYGDALLRHAKYVYNIRICHPREEIVQHSDDVDAAFRRVLYHPNLAIVFAYVFMEFLGIPCGMIFGGRNSPGWFCLSSELRAHIGAVCDFTQRTPCSLVLDTTLPPVPTPEELQNIPVAVPDKYNEGINLHTRARETLNMFVDDNIVATLRCYLAQALHAAVESAFAVYGHPSKDPRRPSVMRDDKWCRQALEAIMHLGYDLCTRKMTIGWPDDKRHALRELIDHKWSRAPCIRTVTEVATLLGLTRHGCYVCPIGGYLSIRLTHFLADHARDAIRSKHWWKHHKVHVPAEVLADLRILRRNLADELSALWCRPIGLLIKREPTCTTLGDAAYTGLGGWSPTFRFFWRLIAAELLAMGFPLHELGPGASEPEEVADPNRLHINVLEFITLIIDLWLTIYFVKLDPTKAGGHIAQLLGDNTSALSWLRYATRTKKTPVRHLAIFAQYLLTFSGTSDFLQLTGCHISGFENSEADAFSRPELHPTLASVIETYSHLTNFHRILIPSELLSTILQLISSPKIEATLEKRMIRCTTLAPIILPAGQLHENSNTLFTRSRRGKRSRR